MKRISIFILLLVILWVLGSAGCAKKSPEEALREAEMKLRKGDLIGARIDLKELLRKYPDHQLTTEARFMLAHCYFAERDYTQCRSHTELLLKQFGVKDERGRAAFELIMNTYRMEGRFADGIAEAEKLLKELKPEDEFGFKIKCMIADLLVDDKKTTDAISRLNNLIAIGKDDLQRTAALERQVSIYSQMNNFDEAIRIYGEYYDKYPEYENKNDLIAGQAFFYDMKGDKDKARELFAKAIQGYQEMFDKTLDRSKKAEFLFRQAKTYELHKEFATAREKYQMILKDFSDTPFTQSTLFAIGDSYYLERQIDKALNYYQEILKSQAQNPQVVQLARARIAAMLRQQAGTRASTQPTSPTLIQQPADEEK